MAFDFGRRAFDRRKGQQPAAAPAVGVFGFSANAVVAEKNDCDRDNHFARSPHFIFAHSHLERAFLRRLVGRKTRTLRHDREKSAGRRQRKHFSTAAAKFHTAAFPVRKLVESTRDRNSSARARRRIGKIQQRIVPFGRIADRRLGRPWIRLERAVDNFHRCEFFNSSRASFPFGLPPSALRLSIFAVACVVGLLRQVRNGHGGAVDRTILSFAAAAAARRRGAIANRPPPLVARFSLRKFDSRIRRFNFDARPSVVAGKNNFVQSRRATSEFPFTFPRAGCLFHLFSPRRSAR